MSESAVGFCEPTYLATCAQLNLAPRGTLEVLGAAAAGIGGGVGFSETTGAVGPPPFIFKESIRDAEEESTPQAPVLKLLTLHAVLESGAGCKSQPVVEMDASRVGAYACAGLEEGTVGLSFAVVVVVVVVVVSSLPQDDDHVGSVDASRTGGCLSTALAGESLPLGVVAECGR
jgi:hypothetical protein